MKNFNQKGFTMVDLIVSAIVIIIIFSFVLANFRGSQRSSELDIVLKQVINGITTVRTMALGGQLIEDEFPAGGYGINFDFTRPDQYVLFAAFEPGQGYIPPEGEGEPNGLDNGIKSFNNIKFIRLCGLRDIDEETGFDLPCLDNQNRINQFLEIVFDLSGEVLADYTGVGRNFKYVGGIIEHEKTGKRAYFYVSLVSGLVTGDTL
jgi:type II secretory pathway pseudopilin PulG